MPDLDLRTVRRTGELLARHREGYLAYLGTIESVGGALARFEMDLVAGQVEAAGLRLGTLADEVVELAATRVALADPRRQGPLTESARAALHDLEQLAGHAFHSATEVMGRLREAQGAIAAELVRTPAPSGRYDTSPLPALLLDRTG